MPRESTNFAETALPTPYFGQHSLWCRDHRLSLAHEHERHTTPPRPNKLLPTNYCRHDNLSEQEQQPTLLGIMNGSALSPTHTRNDAKTAVSLFPHMNTHIARRSALLRLFILPPRQQCISEALLGGPSCTHRIPELRGRLFVQHLGAQRSLRERGCAHGRNQEREGGGGGRGITCLYIPTTCDALPRVDPGYNSNSSCFVVSRFFQESFRCGAAPHPKVPQHSIARKA